MLSEFSLFKVRGGNKFWHGWSQYVWLLCVQWREQQLDVLAGSLPEGRMDGWMVIDDFGCASVLLFCLPVEFCPLDINYLIRLTIR